MNKRFDILFVVFICLAVYYSAIFNPVNSIDDEKMLQHLLNIDNVNLKHLFLPHSSGGYYRPLSMLTFIADRFLWLIDPSFMHLENIILHTLNAVFVYLIASKLFNKDRYIPFFAALLFAVHPINTEAVNWISARCDLLATFFVLIAFYILIYAVKNNGKNVIFLAILSGFFAFLGTLSKEVAVAFFIVAILFIIRKKEDINLKKFIMCLPFVFFAIFYFYLRHIAFIQEDTGFSRVAASAQHHYYINSILIFIQALGFYIKKLIVPFPLNFGIIDVSKGYLYVGFIILILSIIFFLKRNKMTDLFLISILFISPALLVALGNVAWTPYAERYIYTASVFFSIFVVAGLSYLIKKQYILQGALGILIIFFMFSTLERNKVWSSNLSLYKDTVKKSPEFIVTRNQYAITLSKSGKIKEAKKQYIIASSFKGRLAALPSLNLLKASEDSPEQKKSSFYKFYNKLPELNNDILLNIIAINNRMIGEGRYDNKKLYLENAGLYEKLYKNTGDGFYLYKAAQIELSLNNIEQAKKYLIEAKTHLNENSIYFKAADKILKRLKNNDIKAIKSKPLD